MRLIGKLKNQKEAQLFGDYLLTRGVKTQIELEEDVWLIWVYDEDLVEQAKEEFEEFQQSPQEKKYGEGAKAASQIRTAERKKLEQLRKLQRPVRQQWSAPAHRRIPVTFWLILLSVIVSLAAMVQSGELKSMSIGNKVAGLVMIENVNQLGLQNRVVLHEVRQGQIWRLFTPMFYHFDGFHLLFNMMWLHSLGNMLENRKSRYRFLLMVLFISLCCNVGQFLETGPTFGGMSGVVFGLFGFCWIKMLIDPQSGIAISPINVALMFLWFFICFTGRVGAIANTAHAVGLGLGIVLGWLNTMLKQK